MKKFLHLLLLMLLCSTTMLAADAVNYCLGATTAGAGKVNADGQKVKKDINEDQLSYTLNTKLKKGTAYTLKFRAMASEDCTLAIFIAANYSANKDADGNTTDLQLLKTHSAPATTWKIITAKFTPEFDCDGIDFMFGGLGGYIFFDDMNLKEDAVGVNMIYNGDFSEQKTDGWSSKTAKGGTTFKIFDKGNTVVVPGEPFIPDTWEFAQQGDPNFQVYLAFGQSNMEGNAAVEAIDKQNVPERFKMMAAVDFNSPKRTKGNWYTAVPPLCRENTGLTPCDYFGRYLVENLPENVSVGVINVAVGGAQIRLFMEELKDEYINGEADWFKNICKAYNNDPLARLIEMGKIAQKTGVIKGILLHQGCSDNGSGEWCGKVAKIYKRICYRLGLNPEEVPLLAGETLYKNMGGGCYWHNEAALPHLKEAIPNSYVISAKDIPGNGQDAWHFSAAGYRELGKRYGQQMLEILNSQAASVKTVNVDDNKQEVYYNLSGQRLSGKPQHGIYIVNGVKRIAK